MFNNLTDLKMETLTQKTNVMEISRNDLPTFFNDVPRGTFASVLQKTDAKIYKREAKKLGFDKVEKLSKLNVILGADFKTRVENQLARENKNADEYKEGTSWWQYSNDKLMVAEHKVKQIPEYVAYAPHAKSNPKSKFFVDGKLTSKLPNGLLIPRTKATNQGTDKEVEIRLLKFDSIVKLYIKGKVYKVVD